MQLAPDITFSIKDGEVESLLLDISQATGKSVGRIIKDHAMTYARYLAENTMPVAGLSGNKIPGRITEAQAPDGMSTAAKELGETAVSRDIRRVYQHPAAVIDTIKKALSGTAGLRIVRAFKKAVKLGQYIEAKDILRRNNIPGAMYLDVMAWDGGNLHKQKRGTRGKIGKGTKPTIISDGKALDDYLKKKKKLVGYSKSGWITAARPISTRGIGKVKKWITRHNAPGSGMDRTSDANNPSIILTNGVPWATQVLPHSQFIATIQAFERSLAEECENILAAIARKKRGV